MNNPLFSQNENTNNNEDNNTPITEDEALKVFMDILTEKYNSLLSVNPDFVNDYKKNHSFDDERNVIKQMNQTAFRWGMISTIVSFAVLRRAPAAITRKLMGQAHKNGNAGTHGGFGPQQPLSSSTSSPSSYKFDNSKQKSPLVEGLAYSFGLSLDMLLSLWFGFSVSAFLTDKQVLQEEFSSLPLVKGRSVASEVFCDDFVSTYKTLEKERGFDWETSRKSKDFTSFEYIARFVQNCQKRRTYENMIRRDMVLGSSDPNNTIVEIPSPGVPVDTIVTDYHDDDEEEGGAASSSSFEYFEGDSNNDDYFATDSNNNDHDGVITQDEVTNWTSMNDFDDEASSQGIDNDAAATTTQANHDAEEGQQKSRWWRRG